MAAITRTITVNTDDATLAAVDAAMALVYPNTDGTPTVPGDAHTIQCIEAWIADVAARAASKQTDLAIAAAQAQAQALVNQATSIAESIQLVSS